jgi:hypothetical protein
MSSAESAYKDSVQGLGSPQIWPHFPALLRSLAADRGALIRNEFDPSCHAPFRIDFSAVEMKEHDV